MYEHRRGDSIGIINSIAFANSRMILDSAFAILCGVFHTMELIKHLKYLHMGQVRKKTLGKLFKLEFPQHLT